MTASKFLLLSVLGTIALSLFLAFVPMRAYAATYCDDYIMAVQSHYSFFRVGYDNGGGSQRYAVPISIGSIGCDIQEVAINVRSEGSPTGLTPYLYTRSGDSPDTLLATGAAFSGISSTYGTVTSTLTHSLAQGNYFIVLQASGSASTVNYYWLANQNTGRGVNSWNGSWNAWNNGNGVPVRIVGTDPILGCMDEAASNYDPAAQEDDGSCVFQDIHSETLYSFLFVMYVAMGLFFLLTLVRFTFGR